LENFLPIIHNKKVVCTLNKQQQSPYPTRWDWKKVICIYCQDSYYILLKMIWLSSLNYCRISCGQHNSKAQFYITNLWKSLATIKDDKHLLGTNLCNYSYKSHFTNACYCILLVCYNRKIYFKKANVVSSIITFEINLNSPKTKAKLDILIKQLEFRFTFRTQHSLK